MLINSSIVVRHACENGYAVPAVNTNGGTYDLVRAIAETAQEEQAPVIMACYEKNVSYRGFNYAAMVMQHLAGQVDVPVVGHLDHGGSVDVCRTAIQAGFSSVMIDGSHLPIEQNLAMTKAVVAIARPQGVGVEAEIGELEKLGPDGTVIESKNLANPAEVARMASESGVDMLAVGIGNAHGFYNGVPNIRLDMLEKYRAASKIPLVLHGTTGIPDETIQRCIQLGMAKVNLGTLIRTRYVEYTAEVIADGEHQNHPWRICQAVKDRIKQDVRHIIHVTGAAGQAPKIKP